MKNRYDFRITPHGDMLMTRGDDLQTTTESLYYEQQIRFRLQLDTGEWSSSPPLGASLDELRGMEVNNELAKEGKKRIIHALTYDELLIPEEFTVQVSRNNNSLFFSITFHTDIPIPPFKYELHQAYGLKPIL